MWLFRGNIYEGTEGYVLAKQSEVMSTRNYGMHVVNKVQAESCCQRIHRVQ